MGAIGLIDVAATFLAGEHRNLIGGEWVPAQSGATLDVPDPATGEVIARVPDGGAADIDAAVRAARASFESAAWRGLTGDERARVMWRMAELIDQNAEELVHLEVANNGMPILFARWMVGNSAQWLRYFAGVTGKVFGRNASGPMSGGGAQFHAYTAREPIGVVGMIVPWNGPLGTAVIKLAPALAAGCSIVLKPAENTPLTTFRLGQIALEAGLPAGVLNIVNGRGPTAGQALAEHADVNKISFTGSTETGRHIVRTAAGNLKRVTLELGGKSPVVVFDDCNLDVTIPGAAMGIFANTGQVCFAGSRLFVQKKAFDKVVVGIADFAKTVRVGSGFDPETLVGPLISKSQHDKVGRYLEIGKQEGAEVVAGGNTIGGAGWFVEPTVFANVNADMRICREEIFGPVLVATPFDTMDEAVKMANDTRYGLGSGIYTENVNNVHKLAARIEAGNVWVNGYGHMHPAMPFGGYKESGWGRELSEEGLDAFLETKSVFVQLH